MNIDITVDLHKWVYGPKPGDLVSPNSLLYHTIVGTLDGEPVFYGLSVGVTSGETHAEWGPFE
jgi:hypothetical protein